MYNAAFFDVDGTLQSFATRSIPASAVKALELLRSKGLKVFLATGRHKSDLGKIRQVFEFDAYVTLNGQYCFDHDGPYRRLPLDRGDVAVAARQCREKLYSCFFVEEDEKYVNYIDPHIREICEMVGTPLPKECDPMRAVDADVYQLSPYLEKGRESIYLNETSQVESTRWHPYFIDIVAAGGSKQSGILATLEHFGLDNNGVIAFGDGENDITMLTHAKTGVAMGNADDEVKRAADYVTDDVDADGVLNAVLKFVK